MYFWFGLTKLNGRQQVTGQELIVCLFENVWMDFHFTFILNLENCIDIHV